MSVCPRHGLVFGVHSAADTFSVYVLCTTLCIVVISLVLLYQSDNLYLIIKKLRFLLDFSSNFLLDRFALPPNHIIHEIAMYRTGSLLLCLKEHT
jgi:hypothetical protein